MLTILKDADAEPVVEPAPEAALDPSARSKVQTVPAAPAVPAQPEATQAFGAPAQSAETGEYQAEKNTRADMASPTAGRSKDETRHTKVQGVGKAAPAHLPATLGGYQILKELGQGGMGTVVLARQLSLDRPVALKVINERFAGDPRFLGRFTREAYAAAQLVHHNVVQIYDIDEDKGIHFFSMEYVKGRNLMAIAQEKGRLDADVAVGYALQAARGLKFAHDLGMIHRDIKPDNLLLNDQGIVKVADMGLVKLALSSDKELPPERAGASPPSPVMSAALSRAGAVVGTPAYMSPEQGRGQDVDARADIYSLGCTLYVLLTGRQPFQGKTVKQILTQHASEPVVPPDAVVSHVPHALSNLLLRMMAKKPEDRFRDMGEVIEELESYLGVQTVGPFTPREEQANVLESCVQRFNAAPMAKVRTLVMVAFAALCPILILVALVAGQLSPAGAVAGLALLGPLSAFVFHGLFHGSPIFVKVREWVFASSWRDWLLWAAGCVFLVLILYFAGSLWIGLGVLAVSVLGGAGFYFGIEATLFRQRDQALVEAERLFRDLRLRGLEEESLRHFVAKYSGKQWEEFYEALFGYEAMLAAREGLKGESGRARARFAPWRDPVVRWLESRVQARRAAREKRHLQKVEEKYLLAEGVDPKEARRRAARMAEVFVGEAIDLRRPGAASDRVERMRRLLRAAQEDDEEYTEREPPAIVNLFSRIADLVLGARIRFLVACALMVGCLMWVKQNELASSDAIRESATGVLGGKVPDFEKLQKQAAKPTKSLVLPGLPEQWTGIVDSYNAGIIGLVMMLTCVFWGWRAGLAVWLGVVIALRGAHWGVPAAGPLSAAHVSLAAGSVIAIVGGFSLRRG